LADVVDEGVLLGVELELEAEAGAADTDEISTLLSSKPSVYTEKYFDPAEPPIKRQSNPPLSNPEHTHLRVVSSTWVIAV
jgi:hypothetical protein